MNPIDLADTTCWVILLSALITGTMAVIGLVSDKYHDTFSETVSLCSVALTSLVVVAQIYEYGYTRRDGMAALAVSIALYSVAQGLKHLPRNKKGQSRENHFH